MVTRMRYHNEVIKQSLHVLGVFTMDGEAVHNEHIEFCNGHLDELWVNYAFEMEVAKALKEMVFTYAKANG